MNYFADNSTLAVLLTRQDYTAVAKYPELTSYTTDNTSGLPYRYVVMPNLEFSEWAPDQTLDDFALDPPSEIKRESINEERKRKINWN